MLSIPTSFLACNFCPALKGNTHHKRRRAPKSVDSSKWMLQIWTAQCTFRTSWVLDWRLRRRVWQLLYHVLKPEHDISSSVLSLVLKFGLSRLSVRINPRQLYCIVKAVKRISHPHNREVINSPQALSRVLLCTQRASIYDNKKWELW